VDCTGVLFVSTSKFLPIICCAQIERLFDLDSIWSQVEPFSPIPS
jgi:hypothetical protein